MATFGADGFVWEATLGAGAEPATRAEAQAALDELSQLALCTSYGRAAMAAFKMADYRRCIDCCAGAAEKASPERWT
jgi:hypothetical protein